MQPSPTTTNPSATTTNTRYGTAAKPNAAKPNAAKPNGLSTKHAAKHATESDGIPAERVSKHPYATTPSGSPNRRTECDDDWYEARKIRRGGVASVEDEESHVNDSRLKESKYDREKTKIWCRSPEGTAVYGWCRSPEGRLV